MVVYTFYFVSYLKQVLKRQQKTFSKYVLLLYCNVFIKFLSCSLPQRGLGASNSI